MQSGAFHRQFRAQADIHDVVSNKRDRRDGFLDVWKRRCIDAADDARGPVDERCESSSRPRAATV